MCPTLADGTQLTPDDAMAQSRCPECGVDLTKIHALSHFNTHWPAPLQDIREHEEARRRKKMFSEYLKAHPDPEPKE